MEKISRPFLITRNSLPSTKSIKINGNAYNLGILKDFKKNYSLHEFLNDKENIELSWTSLSQNEVLEPHKHPIDTMIIVCKGSAKTLGDLEKNVAEGDIICFPKNSLHGFLGTSIDRFWAISIAFSDLQLYENGMTTL